MKRLINKKANEDISDSLNVPNKSDNSNEPNMMELNELDGTDVKCYRCPNCKIKNLEDSNGFRICKRCGNVYKIFDNKVFLLIGDE
jgi:hypothetical protein